MLWNKFLNGIFYFSPEKDGGSGGDSDNGGSSGDPDPGDKGSGNGDAGGKQDVDPKDELKFSQSKVDEIVTERLKRAKKGWDKEAADTKAKADLSELDRLKAEKLETEGKHKEKLTATHGRVTKIRNVRG